MDEHGLGTEEDPDTTLLGKVAGLYKEYVVRAKEEGVPEYKSEALAAYGLVQSGKCSFSCSSSFFFPFPQESKEC